jgi:hypothetical protein
MTTKNQTQWLIYYDNNVVLNSGSTSLVCVEHNGRALQNPVRMMLIRGQVSLKHKSDAHGISEQDTHHNNESI